MNQFIGYAHRNMASFIFSLAIVLLLIGCSSQPSIKPAAGTFATDLTKAASPSYGLVFIIDPNNLDRIAGYMVMCGEGGGLSMPIQDGLLGTDVDIKEGQFTIDNQDVLIQGKIIDAVTLEGTIEAKSADATKCAIPQSGQWTAKCGAPTGLSLLTIRGRSFLEDVLEGPCK
jgi:hypothetical protein